jgi:hypothetical protein
MMIHISSGKWQEFCPSFSFVVFLLLLCTGVAPAQFIGMRDSAIFIRQYSYNARLMMNSNGVLGQAAFPTDSIRKYFNPRISRGNPYMEQPGLEYPLGSGQDHLQAGGLWVGGIVDNFYGRQYVVSATVADYGESGEFLGHRFPSDTFYVANAYDPNSSARRFIDDDGDGVVDEDPLDGFDNDGDWVFADDWNHNGRPDHGEPHVDEDGGAISEHDLYVTYRDSFPLPRIRNHTPMGLVVWQKSYAWKELIKEPILPIEYVIVNQWNINLDSVYVGFYAKMFLGPYFPRENTAGGSFVTARRSYEIKFLPNVRTAAFGATATITPTITPIGITMLGTSPQSPDLQITFRYLSPLQPNNDSLKYRAMSSGSIDRDTSFGPTFLTPEYIYSIGPFRNFGPGDTLRFSVALVMGERLTAGFNSVQDNATKVLELYSRDFKPPNVPPSPPLRLTQLKNGVMLDWKWQPGDGRDNPEETWDEDNHYLENLPESHWRKQNPPPGKTKGGRVFEGYRLWRSDLPIFDEKTFSLLHQYDVIDDLGFEQQTGIEYRYVDTPIVRGKKYWYAVTTFTIPNYFIAYDTIQGGRLIRDTIQTTPLQSLIFENATLYQLPFTPSSRLSDIKVVPNPYRTDQDYTYEGGGWEGLGRLWSEYKRQIWFIHLPPKCTIRIFTIMGEVVATIHHDDAQRIAQGMPEGQEEWFLLSDSNRAIASGIYVYLVESEFGQQIGKFVVIR